MMFSCPVIVFLFLFPLHYLAAPPPPTTLSHQPLLFLFPLFIWAHRMPRPLCLDP